jgi:gliding motility-associated-like protein
MKFFQKICLLFLLSCFSNASIQATHIVGGELNYRCLTGNSYEISLTVFRDCQNGVPPFDAQAAIGIFDSSNMLITQLLIPFMGDDTLNATLFDSCLVIPPDVCVHRTTYIDTIFLPFLTGGYQLAYQRCCRNYTILNIQAPNQTGATYYTQISELALTTCNSNPIFNAWPPIYICVGKPILFDHSATDYDGDSLVYELSAPFEGAVVNNSMPQPPNPPPYDSIIWRFPFSTTNMMGGTDLLKINSQTGLLTGTPTSTGQYVVGICVKEYRNGVLISSTKRDFQYNVGVCGEVYNAAFFTPSVVCDSNLAVSFNNQSTTSSSYFWDFGDLTSNADTSQIYTPSYIYPDTGKYIITLIVGGEDICADTFSRVVNVQDATMKADFNVVYDRCVDSTVVQLIDQSSNPNSTVSSWQWIFWDGTVDSAQNPTKTIFGQENYQIVLIAGSENGCYDLKVDTISSYPVNISTESFTQICRGGEMFLEVFNLDSTDNLTYQWLPESEIIVGQNSNKPIVAPILTTDFWVIATNQHGCTAIDTLTVQTSNIFPPLAIQSSADSTFPGEPVQLTATFDGNYLYDWLSDSSLSANGIHNPIATPYVPTIYTLLIEDENGCKNIASIPILIRQFECELPYIFIPNAFTPNNDGNNDEFFVRANSITAVYLAVYNRWGQRVFETRDMNQGWDGTFNGMPLEPDVFGYYLEIDCFNGLKQFKKGNVALIR